MGTFVHCFERRAGLHLSDKLIKAIYVAAILRRISMRDVMELLRAKEQELVKVKRQVEALRIAAPLLGGDQDQATPSGGLAMVKDANHLS